MTFLQACASSSYFATTTFSNNKFILPKSEFSELKNGKSIRRKYVLLKNEKLRYPIVVFEIAEGSYSALLMKCTHNGCELQPAGTYLICPCHGSEFDNLGKVQNPPAEQNLQTFQISADDNFIYVQI